MALIDKTFLHYFDIHYLEEKGINNIPNRIYYEAFFATRFAILCSDKVLIPAASYFESPTCRKIIDQYLSIAELGIIWLVGKAFNYNEFCQTKMRQYTDHPEHVKIYKSALNGENIFPFHTRYRSATKDITESWLRILDFSEVPDIFECCSGFVMPLNIEDRWNSVPQLLGKKAFVVQNVSRLLIPESLDNIAVVNRLHGVINKAYFQSYIGDLRASIVSDLVVLAPNYPIADGDNNVPYKYILQELKIKNKLEHIKNMSPEDLILCRERSWWPELFYESLKKKNKKETEIYKLNKKSDSGPTINIKQEIQRVGDTYINKGQAGAIGAGAHAHDINFNQVWNDTKNDLDLTILPDELLRLKTEAKNVAQTPDEFVVIGEIASAEIAAREGRGPKMLEHLKKAGQWALDVATNIGSNVAVEAIKKSMGL